jgi:hypothetical protein
VGKKILSADQVPLTMDKKTWAKKRKDTVPPENDNEGNCHLTYAEALEAVARARVLQAVPFGLPIPPYPDLHIDSRTQVKLVALTTIMMLIGRGPGDFPVAKFDRSVSYRRLAEASLEWLEQCRIPARRSFAPLATIDYIWLFGNDDRRSASEEIERFFSRLVHFLLIETQIITAKQYYHGLGLYGSGSEDPAWISKLNELFPPEAMQEEQLLKLLQVELNQMHGRIFLDYCAVMIRAQWDKLARLSCLVFGLDGNWDSISSGLSVLEQKLNDDELGPWCRSHLQVFIEMAKDRLSETGWIKGFRDHLLHDVGAHSAGVVPHRRSLETTSDLWDKVCDEHDWLREATMAALVAFLSVRPPANGGVRPRNQIE